MLSVSESAGKRWADVAGRAQGESLNLRPGSGGGAHRVTLATGRVFARHPRRRGPASPRLPGRRKPDPFSSVPGLSAVTTRRGRLQER